MLHRANAGMPILTKDEDFAAFERVLEEAVARTGTRLLSAWPVRRASGWLEHVNAPQTEAELTAIRRSVIRGSPFGDEAWAVTATRKLGLEITSRPQGRPKSSTNGS